MTTWLFSVLLDPALAAPPEGAPPGPSPPKPPFFRSCNREPVQTCYDYLAAPSKRLEEDLRFRCELIHGVFASVPCPRTGVTGQCELPDSTTLYYGRTTTPMFGANVPVDGLCTHDHGIWVPVLTVPGRLSEWLDE